MKGDGNVKDWVGNRKSIFTTLGASNHSSGQREEHDYYATEPKATEVLLEHEQFAPTVWESACGEGHISEVLKAAGYDVISTDLIYRGYGEPEPLDFLTETIDGFDGDIITNPPYRYAQEFVETAMKTVRFGHKVAMILRLQFLEGKSRKEMFRKYPPKTIYVFSSRVKCAKNGNFDEMGSSAQAYAWFVWVKGFQGKPEIEWMN